MKPFVLLSATLVGLLTTAQVALASDAMTASQRSNGDQTLWNLERAYWHHVEENDLAAYSGLWHKDFLGWPSVSAVPVHKDHLTDWITSQTSKGLVFKAGELKPAAMQVTGEPRGDVLLDNLQMAGQDGNDQAHTSRSPTRGLRREMIGAS
jgi:hypothetical protein